MARLSSQPKFGGAEHPADKPSAADPPQDRGGVYASRLIPEAPAIGAGGVAIIDVWSRTSRKYRVRAAVFLGLTLILFIALCAFTHWLHVARVFDFSLSSYVQPFNLWGPQTQSLNDFLRYPINVEQTPVHGVVLGLLLASIVAVPILVSILYRFPAALPFVAAVGIFAHLPWMTVTLLLGCVLASVRPFRLSFRYGSALVGMLPVLLYLYLATSTTGEQSDAAAAPTEHWRSLAPWVLAILAACAMMGSVLLIARLVDYRPGAIAPVMAVTFATPAILFFRYVGADQLSYRVIEAEYGPRASRFAPVSDLMKPTVQRMAEQMAQDDGQISEDQLRDFWTGHVQGLHERVLQRQWRGFLSDRSEAFEACRAFIADHRGSPYLASVLYIQARIMDTRIDEREMRASARRELYSDFPHVQSQAAWTALLSEHPESPLATAAAVRLAQLNLRRGECDAALQLLATVLRPQPASTAETPTTRPTPASLLRGQSPEATLNFDPQPYLFEADRLSELIKANAADPIHGSLPLQEFARLDPRRAGYADEVLRLAEKYADCALHDNLLVEWAMSQPHIAARYSCLSACAGQFLSGDALPKALYELAELEIQKLAETNSDKRIEGIARMRELASRFADSCWGRAAVARLRSLAPADARVALAGE